jgi:hypothetical protein
VTLRPRIDAQADVTVTFDGHYGVRLTAGDLGTVRRAKRPRDFRTSSRPTSRCCEKLKWGELIADLRFRLRIAFGDWGIGDCGLEQHAPAVPDRSAPILNAPILNAMA